MRRELPCHNKAKSIPGRDISGSISAASLEWSGEGAVMELERYRPGAEAAKKKKNA
ncbi:MAG: hypothetical protein ACLTLQ_05725 [[Clostridium] scindens]